MMKTIILILFFSSFFSINAYSQNISTIVGTGIAGYSGDNGPATACRANFPDAIKFDDTGNMYITDQYNHVIRKINTSGIISTIAGNGTPGYSGDGGAATDAKLNLPSDIVFDASHNIYITEWGNGTIRKVTPSGVISTIAGTGVGGYSGDGGPATNAKLSDPFGLVFDKSGNLYFSNNVFFVVRKINPAGIISTIAGTGIAGFSGDGGPATSAQIKLTGFLAIGPDNNLYIPDYQNNRIRKVDEEGIITTVIGDGTATGGGDGGPAIAASTGHMWAILFDPTGNMYLSERVSPVIRKVNTAGIITKVAGTGVLGFSGDDGPAISAQLNVNAFCSAVDISGNLYIADPGNNRIRKITYNHVGLDQTDNSSQKKVSIYPNPAKNEVTIIGECKLETLSISNAIGVTVTEVSVSKEISLSSKMHLNISSLPVGLYFVKVNGLHTGKFVKE